MSRILKIVLLWLVMIALPTQGFASAMMIDCGPSYHHAGIVSIPSHDHTAAEVAEHAHADDRVAIYDVRHSHASGKHDVLSKCGACAGCCLGTAGFPPTLAEIMTPTAAGIAIHLSPEKRFAVNFPDGLERPPHSFFI